MENEKPLISVIVPVHNGQDCLADCIHSVEKQTYGNLEVMIVNDGSTDGTGAVCGVLAAQYGNISILTLDGEGVSAARNKGVLAARGELVTFVDADDRICADMLQILYDCMTAAGSDVAGCRFFTWSSEDEWAEESGREGAGETTGVSLYGAADYLRQQLLCGNSRCWSKLYRREIFDKTRFPEDLTIGEDLLFLIRMLPHVSRIAETAYQGYGYCCNPSSAMNREFTPAYMDQIRCWQLAREEVLRMDHSLDARVTAHYMTGIMLTVGKLAMLPAAKRREYADCVAWCSRSLKETVRTPGALARLSPAYRIKVSCYLLCPQLYLRLYHMRKTVR